MREPRKHVGKTVRFDYDFYNSAYMTNNYPKRMVMQVEGIIVDVVSRHGPDGADTHFRIFCSDRTEYVVPFDAVRGEVVYRPSVRPLEGDSK